jgi:hypothetical protein
MWAIMYYYKKCLGNVLGPRKHVAVIVIMIVAVTVHGTAPISQYDSVSIQMHFIPVKKLLAQQQAHR